MARHTLPRGLDKAVVEVRRYVSYSDKKAPTSNVPLTNLFSTEQIDRLLSLCPELKKQTWHGFLMTQWINGYDRHLSDPEQQLSTTIVLEARDSIGDLYSFLKYRVENLVGLEPTWPDAINVPDWFNTQSPVTDWRHAEVLLTRYVDAGRGMDDDPFKTYDFEPRSLRDVIRDERLARKILSSAKPLGKCQILMTIRPSNTRGPGEDRPLSVFGWLDKGSFSLTNSQGNRIVWPRQFEIIGAIRGEGILTLNAWDFGQDGYWPK